MSILVAITGWDPDEWVHGFRAAAPHRAVFDAREPFDPAAVHYAVTWKPKPRQFADLPNLKAIFNLGAGVDAILKDDTLPDVPLCRIVNGDLTARMTEFVVMNCLIHLRHVEHYRTNQAQRRWKGVDQPAASAVRVGVMGLGVLGKDAVEVLARIGFRVSGWSRTPATIPGITAYAGEAELDAFLGDTDILVALLPLTPETRHILNAALFKKLARDGVLGGPILINAGRGGLQNEADLLAALTNGTLKAASLDVFETEPLPAESAFWALPNVIITPHSAADSTPSALVAGVLANIERYEKTGTLIDVVERGRGY